ncbi:glycosyltransferase family 9 protein [Mesorhizobium sp. M1163]|uniref:glycosyltransferase family 9 protein n=1 Tax=Mesorhizobium sp. M1163 TaxID=2957065 RepID=UPI00333DBD32
MHLAASVGTPVVGLYGLTPPDIWGPLGVPHRSWRLGCPANALLPTCASRTIPVASTVCIACE